MLGTTAFSHNERNLSVKKRRSARIRVHGYTRDRCKTDQGPLGVRTDRPWISRYSMTDERVSCTRIRITRDRDTEILVRNESGIGRLHTVDARVSHGYRKWGPRLSILPHDLPDLRCYTRLYIFSLFTVTRGKKYIYIYMLVILRAGYASRNLNGGFER